MPPQQEACGKTHVATGAPPVQARAKPGAPSRISRSPFAEARSPARVRPPEVYEIASLIRQRRKEFKPKAETAFRTNNGSQVRARGCIKFHFEQVARAQQNARIKNHTALAQLSSAARDHSRGKPFGSNYFDRQINRNTRPAARLVGDKHSADHPLIPPRYQITEVQADACSTVQWVRPAISRRFWQGKCWACVERTRPERSRRNFCPLIFRSCGQECPLHMGLRTPPLGKCGHKKTETRSHAQGALTHLM